MKVKAIALGHDNVQLREPGDVFDMPDEAVLRGGPAWFEPVDEADKAKVEAVNKELAARKVAVAAVDPAKQAVDYAKSVDALAKAQEANVKAQAENDELRAELEALKKKSK